MLADQMYEIWDDLGKSGYGEIAALARSIYLDSAQSSKERDDLLQYWREYVKEALAAGPRIDESLPQINILRGEIPSYSPYRSTFMDRLRANADKLPVGKFKSPLIEPVSKRLVEFAEPQDTRRRGDALVMVRKEAAAKFAESSPADFASVRGAAKYKYLIDRYASKLMPQRFRLDHAKKGVLFRKSTQDGKWDFVLEDVSIMDVDFGMISPFLGITRANAAVVPLARWHMFQLPMDNILPGFHSAMLFSLDSYPELCLAADTIAFLCGNIFPRIEKLIV